MLSVTFVFGFGSEEKLTLIRKTGVDARFVVISYNAAYIYGGLFSLISVPRFMVTGKIH
jgi:hypothetical protein